MKKSTLSLLVLCWTAIVHAQSITLPAVSASIQFTNPITSSNMSLVVDNNPGDEAYTVAATIAGTPCQKIPAGKFMYIKCDRATIPTSQTNLLIAVTYYANSNNNIWFNYNGTSNDYQGADFAKTKSDQWVTTIVTITDGALKGVMNGSSDFRMGFNNEDNYIKEIKVYKGSLDPISQPVPSSPGSSISGFIGKSFAGYQIWHQAGTTAADWVHWSYGVVPAAGFGTNENVAGFPDISEYPDSVLYNTNFASLGNGKSTKLYNDADSPIINRQMNWLKTAGMDGVAIQRFVGPIGRSITITPTSSLTNVKNACEATGKLFYICYDLNGIDATILKRMQMDWVYEIEQMRALTSSPNYATVNGKPVVEMWGVGYDLDGETYQECMDLINFLHSRGCYVIGGTPRGWRTNSEGALPSFDAVYSALDCISPWTVGVYNDTTGANNYLTDKMIADKAYCDANNKLYLPVVFAGSANWLNADGSFSQTDRLGGKLLWKQVLNAKSIGLTGVYYAMFDEFEESTELIKGAVDYFDIPTDQYFETFSKDGVWVGSDYYMRLAATAAKMLRGEVATTTTIPVPYSLGPIYYRNSFESRTTTYNMNGATKTVTLKIDPCFYNPAVISSSNINSPSVAIVNEASFTKSGLYSTKITGTPTSSTASSYYYKVGDVTIGVKSGIALSFWKYSANTLGQYTSVDLQFKSGKTLHSLSAYKDNDGNALTPTIARGAIGSWEKFSCLIGTGELIGDTITGIVIAYDHPASSGSITAYFDDIILQDSTVTAPVTGPYGGTPWLIPGKIEAEDYDLGGEGVAYHDNDAVNHGTFRPAEGVDAEGCDDTGGGYDVGFTDAGEWMNYTVNVAAKGTYTLQVRVSSGATSGTNTLHIELNGVNISGTITVPPTGDWQTYTTLTVTTPALDPGIQILKIVEETGGFNINYLNFIPVTWQPCPGATNTLVAAMPQSDNSYQWQVSTDSGSTYTNINNSSNYAGTTTDTLSILNTTGTLSGNIYRCIITNAGVSSDSQAYTFYPTDTWTGAVNTAWETAGNWSCNVVPDASTNVLIPSGTVIVNSEVSIRSLQLSPSVQLTINAGKQMHVLH